ncbi:MAG: DnaA ATPase domain-containing protein, partial [Pontibacterium sp.]
MSNQVPLQIPLSVDVRGNARFENFLAQGNELAIASLQATARGEGEYFTYLWGSIGAGVSHLLKASSHLAESLGRSTEYLRLDQQNGFCLAQLEKYAQVDLLCLDNLQEIAGNAQWEEAIFHLFNERRDKGLGLIIAANAAPRHVHIHLADLSSRLSWGMAF